MSLHANLLREGTRSYHGLSQGRRWMPNTMIPELYPSDKYLRAPVRFVSPSDLAPPACQNSEVLDFWDDTALYTHAKFPVFSLDLDRARIRI